MNDLFNSLTVELMAAAILGVLGLFWGFRHRVSVFYEEKIARPNIIHVKNGDANIGTLRLTHKQMLGLLKDGNAGIELLKKKFHVSLPIDPLSKEAHKIGLRKTNRDMTVTTIDISVLKKD